MTMGDKHQDHYSAAIDLSNNCRKFYYNHMKTTEEFKRSVSRSRRDSGGRPNGTVKSRLDTAMEKLRTEMAELMDQDLSLMEQLLTLNDNIEEMKHKYMYSVSKDSLGASSCNLSTYYDYSDSEMSLASLDINDYNEDSLFESEMDIREKGTRENDEVFVEGTVGIDDAFKRWVKRQRSDKEIDSESELAAETHEACDSVKNLNSEEKLPRCQSEGFVVSGHTDLPNLNVESKTQFKDESLGILSPVTDGATEKSNGCSDKHGPKAELPCVKLDISNVENHEAKHFNSSFISNISTEPANFSYDSDDNINIEDFDDTILNV